MQEEISLAWIDATTQLSHTLSPTNKILILDQNFVKNVLLLIRCSLGDILLGWYLDHMRNYFVQIIAPRFWNHFADLQANNLAVTTSISSQVVQAVTELHGDMVAIDAVLSELRLLSTSNSPSDTKQTKSVQIIQPCQLLRVVLFTEENSRSFFRELLFWFFLRHFLKFNEGQGGMDEGEKDNSVVEATAGEFTDLCAKLHYLDLILISEEIFTEILFDQIENYITSTCKSEFQQPLLPTIQHWANAVLFKWLELVLRLDKSKNFQMFQQWKTRLEFNIYETFANLRIQEIFELIVDYPDSIPALVDLQACLMKTSQHNDLVAALRKSHAQRLLHPGANTSDIISQYISTIKAMRLIDPSSVILDQVSEPIRNYLRCRADTIRCIVTSFTGAGTLFEEFRRGDHKLDYPTDEDDDDDEDDDVGGEDDESDRKQERKRWIPDPLTASPNKRRHRKQDTISMLVNIYGSSEMFVDEYRNMLADRLIAITDYDVDKEVRNLELLKLRFDEASLHNCEIMLKDMADSKRTNASINANLQKAAANGTALEEPRLDIIIVSHLFWPTIKEESVTLPAVIQRQFESYCKQYEHLKSPRQLTKKPHLGSVTLDLEMGETTLTFAVSPAHASIIWLFQDDNKSLSLDSIAGQVGIPRDIVRKKLAFWVNNQILQETEKDIFQLVDAQDSATGKRSNTMPSGGMMADEEEPKQAPSAAAQQEEKLRECQPFIIGMLTNLGTLPLERIHTVLSMTRGDDYTATIGDLKAFMGKLAKEERIEQSGTEYTIKT